MFESLSNASTEIGSRINARYLADETGVIGDLLELARCSAAERRRIEAVRRDRSGKSGLDAFLHAYDLSSAEGVVLRCRAESLLRIPDAETADAPMYRLRIVSAPRTGLSIWVPVILCSSMRPPGA